MIELWDLSKVLTEQCRYYGGSVLPGFQMAVTTPFDFVGLGRPELGHLKDQQGVGCLGMLSDPGLGPVEGRPQIVRTPGAARPPLGLGR